MKIAFITIRLYGGGAEKSNLTIIRMLRSIGHEVDTFCFLSSVNKEILTKELPIVYLDEGKGSLFYKKIFKPKILLDKLNKTDYDIVIDGRTRGVFLKELILQKIVYRNFKKVFLIHSSNTKNYLLSNRLLSRYLYSNQLLVTVSKDIKEKVSDYYGFSKVTFIPNALPQRNDLISCDQDELKSDYILFFGRLVDDVKDISFLIRSYKESLIYKKGYKFLILGSGKDEEKLKQLVQELDIKDQVIFIPFVVNPLHYIKQARFSVMASFYEGMPMSLIESLSVGCPVITTNFISGPSEIVIPGQNGILIEEKSIQNFSSAMNKMCEDEIFYQKCVEGSKLSVEKFSFTNVSEKWIKFLKEI